MALFLMVFSCCCCFVLSFFCYLGQIVPINTAADVVFNAFFVGFCAGVGVSLLIMLKPLSQVVLLLRSHLLVMALFLLLLVVTKFRLFLLLVFTKMFQLFLIPVMLLLLSTAMTFKIIYGWKASAVKVEVVVEAVGVAVSVDVDVAVGVDVDVAAVVGVWCEFFVNAGKKVSVVYMLA